MPLPFFPLSIAKPPLDMTIAGTLIVSVMFAACAVLQSTVMGRFGMSENTRKTNRLVKETIWEG